MYMATSMLLGIFKIGMKCGEQYLFSCYVVGLVVELPHAPRFIVVILSTHSNIQI